MRLKERVLYDEDLELYHKVQLREDGRLKSYYKDGMNVIVRYTHDRLLSYKVYYDFISKPVIDIDIKSKGLSKIITIKLSLKRKLKMVSIDEPREIIDIDSDSLLNIIGALNIKAKRIYVSMINSDTNKIIEEKLFNTRIESYNDLACELIYYSDGIGSKDETLFRIFYNSKVIKEFYKDNSNLQYYYDILNKLDSKIYTLNDNSLIKKYIYNDNGDIESVYESVSGKRQSNMSYKYNSHGKIDSIYYGDELISSFSYVSDTITKTTYRMVSDKDKIYTGFDKYYR